MYVHFCLDDIHHHWRGEQNQLLQIPCLFPHKICNTHIHTDQMVHLQLPDFAKRAQSQLGHACTHRRKKNGTISSLRHTRTHSILAFLTAVIRYLLSVMRYEVLNAPKINLPPAEPLDCRKAEVKMIFRFILLIGRRCKLSWNRKTLCPQRSLKIKRDFVIDFS